MCLHNAQLDVENDTHDLIPGLWRANANMHEVNTVTGPNRDHSSKETTRIFKIVLQQSSRIAAVAISYDNSTVKRIAFGLYFGILATSLQNSYFIFSLVHVYINIGLWLLYVLLYMLLLVYPAKCLCDYKHWLCK